MHLTRQIQNYQQKKTMMSQLHLEKRWERIMDDGMPN